MTFKFNAPATFPAIAFLSTPGGTATKVRVTFNYKTPEEYDALHRAKGKSPSALMAELIADWDTEDAADGSYEGMEKPFSLDALKQFEKDRPRVLNDLLRTYTYEVTGSVVGN